MQDIKKLVRKIQEFEKVKENLMKVLGKSVMYHECS